MNPRTTKLAVLVSVGAASALLVVGCAASPVSPPVSSLPGLTETSLSLGHGTSLSVSIPSARLTAGAVATVTVTAANATESVGVAPDVTLVVAGAGGETVSTYYWQQDPSHRRAGVCQRCHRQLWGMPLRPRATVNWPLGFVVPLRPGRYTIQASVGPLGTPVETKPLAFDSVSTPLAHPIGPGADPALRLLANYGLHPIRGPEYGGGTLTADDVEAFGPASRAIGLNLKSHLGQTVLTLAYPLQGSSRDGTFTATFFVAGDMVVGAGYAGDGAHLLLGGGPLALSDKSGFQ